MLSVTSHIVCDISPVVGLWNTSLNLYLASFAL